MDDIDVTYYLMHSMSGGQAFPERDRQIAQSFAMAARQAGVIRIVYLGALGDPSQSLSEHLISRHEVGSILATSGASVVEFRAPMVVGSGSLSFEMIRSLTERLPVMITPRWLDRLCQPIAVRNVLEYLIEALDHRDAEGIYEIGGSDVLSYREMMLEYAHVRGLRRRIFVLPVPHPQWSSRFVDLVTPIPYAIAQPLVASLNTDMTVRSDRLSASSRVRPMGYRAALEMALARVASDEVETTWASSLAGFSADHFPSRQLAIHEGMLFERHRIRCSASPETVFDVVCELGGDRGWPAGNALWQIRGSSTGYLVG